MHENVCNIQSGILSCSVHKSSCIHGAYVLRSRMRYVRNPNAFHIHAYVHKYTAYVIECAVYVLYGGVALGTLNFRAANSDKRDLRVELSGLCLCYMWHFDINARHCHCISKSNNRILCSDAHRTLTAYAKSSKLCACDFHTSSVWTVCIC